MVKERMTERREERGEEMSERKGEERGGGGLASLWVNGRSSRLSAINMCTGTLEG